MSNNGASVSSSEVKATSTHIGSEESSNTLDTAQVKITSTPELNESVKASIPNDSFNSEETENLQLLTEEGKKAYSKQEFEIAIYKFGEASRLSEKLYGEQSPQYADSLIYYGRALFENAIAQSSVLGNSFPSKDPETDHVEIPLNPPPDNKRFFFEGEPNFGQDEGEEIEVIEAQAEEADLADQETSDQLDDLCYAWEALDAARVIYSRIGTEAAKIILGDLYIILGDISLENESFDKAVVDFKEGLNLKLAQLTEDDRQLAEAYPFLKNIPIILQNSRNHLALGLELTTQNQTLAVEHVQKAMEVLKKHKLVLNTSLISLQEGNFGKGKGLATAIDDPNRIEKELKEIDGFLQDMEAKVKDMESGHTSRNIDDQNAVFDALLKSAFTTNEDSLIQTCEPELGAKSKHISVNDLTSLIKRKNSKITLPAENNSEPDSNNPVPIIDNSLKLTNDSEPAKKLETTHDSLFSIKDVDQENAQSSTVNHPVTNNTVDINSNQNNEGKKRKSDRDRDYGDSISKKSRI
ncbi:hypothetical protein G9A89_012676 [Geosiphon pyriformis]|nr:hypothetical protein G9A89_012676 [Geosiphon pyriformis]